MAGAAVLGLSRELRTQPVRNRPRTSRRGRAAVLVGLGVLARRFGPKMLAIDWEKRLEAMPDNAPPKWMFRNITRGPAAEGRAR